MKLTINKSQFAAAFASAAIFCPARSAMPVLTHVKLDASGAKATLTATDLEVGIEIEIEGVAIDKPGVAILPCGQMASILRESEDEMLRIDASDSGIKVLGERSSYKLPTIDAAEYPAFAKYEVEAGQPTVACAVLRELLRKGAFATDAESSRFSLGGAMFEIGLDKLTVVSTDGKRCVSVSGDCQAAAVASCLIRRAAVDLLAKALPDEGTASLAIRNNDVLFRTPNSTIYCRQLEGRFPRWRDIVPARLDSAKIETSVEALRKAIRQTALVLDSESRGVNFDLTDGTLSLSASSRGESEVAMPVAYDGPPLATSLNYVFVLDLLKVLNSEQAVTLDIANSEESVVLTADTVVYVIMPISRK